MQIDDAEYAPTYYSILALDQTGNASRCVKPPQFQNNWNNNGRAPTRFTPRENNGPRVNTVNQAATFPNNIPLGGNNRESNRPANNGAPLPPECFGCGKDDGHRMFDCGELKDLLQRGIVKHDEQTGKLRMADGTFIRRLPGEYIATAARRLAPTPNVMFGITDHTLHNSATKEEPTFSHVVIREAEEGDASFEVDESGSEADTEDDEGEVYLTLPKRQWQVNAADRTVPSTRVARKQTFDGVHLPKRTRFENSSLKNKEEETTVPSVVKTGQAKAVPGQVRDILEDVQPYDARQPRKVTNEDIDMKDVQDNRTSRKAPKGTPRQSTPKEKEANQGKDDTSPDNTGRRSEIQSTVHLPEIVERILDLEIPMSVREALVASKEIRTNLQDVMRVKNTKAVLMGAQAPLISQYVWPRTDGVLIRVEMEVNGRQVTAIIDTGSQLNVATTEVLYTEVDRRVMAVLTDGDGQRNMKNPALTTCGELGDEFLGPQASAGSKIGIETQEGTRRTGEHPHNNDNNLGNAREFGARSGSGASHPQCSENKLGRVQLLQEMVVILPSWVHTVLVLGLRVIIALAESERLLSNQHEHIRAVEQRIRELEADVLGELPVRPRRGFGAVDERPLSTTSTLECVQAAAVEAYASAERNHHPTIRPGELRTSQVYRLRRDELSEGQDVYSAVCLNAELRIQDPATGEMGTETGHAHFQFFKRPHDHQRMREWKLRAPYVAQRDVRRVTLQARRAAQEKERKELGSPSKVNQLFVSLDSRTDADALQQRQLTGSGNHYISHPADVRPRCNTDGMQEVGLTTDGQRVVLKAGNGINGLPERPGTPMLPAILHNQCPSVVPSAPPNSPISELILPDAAPEPYVSCCREVKRLSDVKNSVKREEEEVVLASGDDAMVVEEGEIVRDTLPTTNVIAPSEPTTSSVGTSDAEMADVSTGGETERDQWAADRLRPIRLTRKEVAAITAGYRNGGKPVKPFFIPRHPPPSLSRFRPILPALNIPLPPRPPSPTADNDSPPPLRTPSPVTPDDSSESAKTTSSSDYKSANDKMKRHSGRTVEETGKWMGKLSEEVASANQKIKIHKPQPLRTRHPLFLNDILNPVDDSSDSPPSSSSEPTHDAVTKPHPPLDAASSSAHSAVYTPSDDKILVPTDHFVRAIRFIHVTVSAGACSKKSRADTAIDVRRSVVENVSYKHRADVMIDQWALVPGHEFLEIAHRDLFHELNHRAMGRVTYVNEEAHAAFRDEERLDKARIENESKVTVYLDDVIIGTNDSGQKLIIDSALMDAVTTKVGRHLRRLDSKPVLIPLHDDEEARPFTQFALDQGPEHCAAINMIRVAQSKTVQGLTILRGKLLEFGDRLIALSSDRRIVQQPAVLDYPSPYPCALLTVAEFARFRICHAGFYNHGFRTVADTLSRVMHVQFKSEQPQRTNSLERRFAIRLCAPQRSLTAPPSPGLTLVLKLLSRPFDRFPLVANLILAEPRDYLPPGVTAITLIGGGSYKWIGLAMLPPNATRCAPLWLYMRTVIKRLPLTLSSKGQIFYVRVYDHYRIFVFPQDTVDGLLTDHVRVLTARPLLTTAMEPDF
ncbi:hypothetical protein R3P38DRAFT_2788083 [Favolaschia claudopus]|uniref:Peptidase A2 domain-containing protein n=1 Tax=Favolaschia claudopus TaxID=2862362 RepID=A0AAW0AP05_9AGAR